MAIQGLSEKGSICTQILQAEKHDALFLVSLLERLEIEIKERNIEEYFPTCF